MHVNSMINLEIYNLYHAFEETIFRCSVYLSFINVLNSVLSKCPAFSLFSVESYLYVFSTEPFHKE